MLKGIVKKYGENWPYVSHFLKKKTSKQCKNRWNYLKARKNHGYKRKINYQVL